MRMSKEPVGIRPKPGTSAIWGQALCHPTLHPTILKARTSDPLNLESSTLPSYSSAVQVFYVLCKFTLKSFGEYNDICLLKSFLNLEFLIYNISIDISSYFINTFFQKKIIFQMDAKNFNSEISVV